LLIALLLDARPEIRTKAEHWLQLPEPFLQTDSSEALSRLRELFADMIGLLGSMPVENMPVTRELWQAQKEKLEGRIRDLQTENHRLKGVDDRLSNVTTRLKKCVSDLLDAQKKAAETENALRQKTRESQDVAAELSREISHREDRLKAAVDLALAQEFYGWLANARAVEAKATCSASHDDLLAQAEAALKKQEAVDRHSRNRTTLAERLEHLEKAHKRVQSALRNALCLTPELKAVEPILASEILALSNLLEPDAAATPLENALLTRIHAASDNDLPHLREIPELFSSLHLLDNTALSRIRQAFQKRLSAVQAVSAPPDMRTEERQNTSSLLGHALSGKLPAILLVDGHNVLFGLPTRYSPPRGTALTEAEKRKRVTDDIVRIAAPNPSLRVWIIFDGPTRSDAQAAPNVRVTYSGGQGEHRADGVILDNIRFFKTSSPETPVIIASNDNDLCIAARRLGAKDLPVLDLGAFF